MPEFSLSENASGPLPKWLSHRFNAKIYPLDYAKIQNFKQEGNPTSISTAGV